jgi:rubrerythrin
MYDGYSFDFDDCDYTLDCIDMGIFKNKADFVEVKRGFWLVNRSSTEARFICSECGFMHIEADPEANFEYNGCPMCFARLDKRKEGADNG